jgi:hypothetical protein
MSRIAAAYLNIPAAQLDEFPRVKGVFARNTKRMIDSALQYAQPAPEIQKRAQALKLAADEVVRADGDEDRFARAKADFLLLTNELRAALLELHASPEVVRSTEILALTKIPTVGS